MGRYNCCRVDFHKNPIISTLGTSSREGRKRKEREMMLLLLLYDWMLLLLSGFTPVRSRYANASAGIFPKGKKRLRLSHNFSEQKIV